jgi:hypothetical protein
VIETGDLPEACRPRFFGARNPASRSPRSPVVGHHRR